MDFDVRRYLGGKQHFFMAAAPSGVPGSPWWDINNGMFTLNFGHPLTAEVIKAWGGGLEELPSNIWLRRKPRVS